MAYFRDYEDAQVRADELEGTRRFAPAEGVPIANHSRLGAFTLERGAFESYAAAEEHIYVFCGSNVLSKELCNRFQSDVCVEIVDVNMFSRRLRTALGRTNKRLIHGEVSYYSEGDGPGAAWELPDQIVMSKVTRLQLAI